MQKFLLEDLKKELEERNIKLSYQRLKVLQYLVENSGTHPTVDQIFTDLQDHIPTLSKTTIYNTLKLLVKLDLIRVITISDKESRYDIDIKDHGHFKCESCGQIYDFKIKLDLLESEELNNFKIDKKDVYFKGICPRCH